MKRPYFQFYPSDWRSDSAVRLCSLAARGLWLELLCLMHEIGQQKGNRYGYLEMKGKRLTGAKLACLIGVDERQVCLLLDELQEAGVFERDQDAVIFSKRFIRDAKLYELRKQAGSKGGSKSQAKAKQKGKQKGKQKEDFAKQKGKQTLKQNATSASRAIDRASDHVPSEDEDEYEYEYECNKDKEREGAGRENLKEVYELFNKLCPSLPRVQKLNDSRRTLIRNRRKEKVDFKTLFSLAETSDFLTGKSGGSFQATFDWILKAENCLKTLEGNYRNRPKKDEPDRDYANAFG